MRRMSTPTEFILTTLASTIITRTRTRIWQAQTGTTTRFESSAGGRGTHHRLFSLKPAISSLLAPPRLLTCLARHKCLQLIVHLIAHHGFR
jgi:hypothetical protein